MNANTSIAASGPSSSRARLLQLYAAAVLLAVFVTNNVVVLADPAVKLDQKCEIIMHGLANRDHTLEIKDNGQVIIKADGEVASAQEMSDCGIVVDAKLADILNQDTVP